MERDSAESQGSEEDCDPLGLVYGSGEDDGGLAGEFGEEVDEVGVFVFVGDEEVGLEEGGDGLVFV